MKTGQPYWLTGSANERVEGTYAQFVSAVLSTPLRTSSASRLAWDALCVAVEFGFVPLSETLW
jgi:hypothetical protein